MKTITIDQIRKNGSIFIDQLLNNQKLIFEYKSQPLARIVPLRKMGKKQKLDVRSLAGGIKVPGNIKLTIKQMKDLYDEDTYRLP